jgi:superfamily I DNA and/or RNA helicase
MALYPSQVELIRLLMHRHPALAGKAVRVEVGLPSAFRQREFPVALLSLTRSHGHRAVTYGDHPQTLVQALTRASARLVIFGDPGTLLRRSQWQGSVDHLDETSAGRERHLIAQLVRYIQGHGRHSRAFRLREGSSV